MELSFINGEATLKLSGPEEMQVLKRAGDVYAEKLADAAILARRYLLIPEATPGLEYDDRLHVRLGCGKTKAYELLNAGALKGRQIGSRWVVDEQDVREYLRCGRKAA
jgi:excisionase family DNA binding protein